MKNRLLPLLAFFFITSSLCRAQTPILWGMTNEGGQQNRGIIFSLNTATDLETNVHNFTTGTDGYGPWINPAFIQASNGLLYGMSWEGGTHNDGAIFSYNISTGMESLIYSFNGDSGMSQPFGSLIQASNGLLYGLTNASVIFSYNIATGVVTIVCLSVGAEAARGSLIQASDSLLYGMNVANDDFDGAIFSYNINTGVGTVLHNFGGSGDGNNPFGSLIQANDGNLYGMTLQGGANKYAGGVIFSYDISTGTETVLYDFGAGTDGENPEGSLIQASNGLLYGLTSSGGVYGFGIIFSYNISTGVVTDLHDFGAGYDGEEPEGSLIQASNGLLYGAARFGGFYGDGMAFSYDISTGVETDIHDFSGPTADGNAPYGSLLAIDSTIIFPTPVTSSICDGGSDTLSVTGATSYTWIPATGLSATTGSSVIASPTVTTTYTITGTTGPQTSTKNVTVTVIPPPSITVNTSSLIICTGGTTKLTASGGVEYTWSPAAGLSSTVGSEIIADPTVTTTYTVTGINSNGCSATNSVVVTVLSASTPTITATPDPSSYCAGGSSVLTASGGNNYTWSPSTGLSATTGSSITANPAITTIYTVTGTNLGGCSAENTVTVTVNPNPTITVSGNPTSYCPGGNAILTAKGGDTYTWSPSAGLSTTTGAIVGATPTVTTTYFVVGTSNGCSSGNSVAVTVNANPVLTAVPVPTSYCSGGSATLTASGANSYTWTPSTGLSSIIGPSVAANPTITTVYRVTGTNSYGCSTTDTVLVTVNPNPTVTAAANPSSYCSGGISTITASGANTYTWSPSTDLDATTGEIVAADPTETATYIVIGTNSSGCQGSSTVVISVGTSATVTATAFPLAYCGNGSTTLTAMGCNTYTWEPSTGLSDTTGSMVTASPNVTTTYTINGSSGVGCTGTTTVTVTVNPNPTITVNSPVVCTGDSAILTANGATTYTWTPSAGLSATTGSSVVAGPSVTTTYIITGTNTFGCTGEDTAVVTIVKSPNPPSFHQHGDTLISTAVHDNQWYLNGTPLAGDTSQELIITSVGEYWVIVNNEANGCSAASDSMNITQITGINQLSLSSDQLSVYPNPTSGEITITSTKPIDDLKVINLLGQQVYESQPKQTQFTFELKNEGMYFVTVTVGGETSTSKIIVSK